jgi:hypothetical protein
MYNDYGRLTFEFASPHFATFGITTALFCLSGVFDLSNVTYVMRVNYTNQSITTGTSEPISFSLGNIAAFLGADPFYPFTGTSNRYSYIYPVNAIQDVKNCVSIASGSDPLGHSITLLSTGGMPTNVWQTPPVILFLTPEGTVRGSKHGTLCLNAANVTEIGLITRYNTMMQKMTCGATQLTVGSRPCIVGMKRKEEVCEWVRELKENYTRELVGAGMVANLVPQVLARSTLTLDEELVFAANQTIYANPEEFDTRNPRDATRSQGIFPNCGLDVCADGQFTSKVSGRKAWLHDQVFRAQKALKLAQNLLPNCIL